MKTKRNLLLLLVTFMGLLSSPVMAQEADQRIGDLINQSDWFRLDEEYPALSACAQSIPLKKLAEVMLATYFNRPEEAIRSIEGLLTNHQDFLGFDNISNLVMLRAKLTAEQGHYAEGADMLNGFLSQVEGVLSPNVLNVYRQTADHYNEVRELPASILTRPATDTEIPLTIEKAGRGVLMFVPVMVNGKVYKFIFDTGAASTFLSSRMANEMGVHIVRDSLTIVGATATEQGCSGLIDKMTIGDISFSNVLVSIANPNPTVDTVYQVDAVLGADFMRLAGEVQIYPKAGKIVFPIRKTPLPETGRNMWMYNNGMQLKLTSGSERLRFVFDTGDVRASLFKVYYNKHKAEVDRYGVKDSITTGGLGAVRRVEVICLPDICLQLGKTAFKMPGIQVEPAYQGAQANSSEDGSLGMDFIRQFERIVISLDKMFVEVE